ncbi:MAG TPA: hypothetical protein VEB19_01260 [Gemmatimonadaceae bacterium]|nr:hypothetical protein [Gemmatimonadaceae bacterium]
MNERAGVAVSMSRRELAYLVMALAGGTIALLSVSGVLWTRPLWMDELATAWVTAHASPVDVVRHIARGGEWSPPAYHLLVWIVRQLSGGGLDPIVLRSVSALLATVAIALVYATLRRRVEIATAAAATLVMVGHSLFIEQAFEGRMYAGWLAAAAFYAWSLGQPQHTRGARVRQGLAAVLLVAVHWFGILSLGLMAVGALLARTGALRDRIRLVVPSAAGIIALIALSPLVLAQRRAASGILWVPEITLDQTTVLLRFFLPAAAMVIVAIAAVASVPWRESASAEANPDPLNPGIAALTSLVLMPLVLILVSLLLQPSMLPRYAVVTVLGWPAIFALAIHLLDVRFRVALVTVFSFVAALSFADATDVRQVFARRAAALQSAVREAGGTRLPVVLQAIHPMYYAALPTPGAPPPARYISVPDSAIAGMYDGPYAPYVRRHLHLEREIAAEHERLFGFPPSVALATLDTTPAFALVADAGSLPPQYGSVQQWARRLLPNHSVRRVSPLVSILERQAR